MRKFSLFLASLCLLGSSQCANVPIDASAAAAPSNDYTVVFSGPGVQANRGYLFFQKRVGTTPSEVLSIIVPGLNCKRESCMNYQFFRQDGSLGIQGGIQKGSTQAEMKLSDVIGSDLPVTQNEDGEYAVIIQLFYNDAQGDEHTVTMNGFIRLNVLSSNYSPVGCNDPSIGYRVKLSKTCEVQFTTSGRSAVCGKC